MRSPRHKNGAHTRFQATLEAEQRAKGDMLRVRKKLETDLSDYEAQLAAATRAQHDASKNAARYQQQLKGVQVCRFD